MAPEMKTSVPVLGLACVLLGLLCVEPARAALDFHPVFRTIDAPGLPDQHVEAIIQDRHGYIWIGTRGGLVRHEGRDLSFLPRDSRHPHSLPDNNIMSLHAHSDGMVWAGVFGEGVVEIGPDLIPRRHLPPLSSGGQLPYGHVWAMSEDCEGHLWIAFMRGGVARFDPESEALVLVPQAEESGLLPTGFQTDVLVDSRCRVWLAQTGRLSVLTEMSEQPVFTHAASGGPGSLDVFIAVIEHSQLGILVSRRQEVLLISEGDQSPAVFDSKSIFSASGFISGMAELPDGRVIVATTNGPYFLDPFTGRAERVEPRPDLPEALPDRNLAGATLVDHEGGVWLAVNQRGLVYLPPDHAVFSRLQRGFRTDERFVVERVTHVAPGLRENTIWIGGQETIQRLDLDNGAIEHARDLFPDYAEREQTRDLRIQGLWEHADGLVALKQFYFWWLAWEAGSSEYPTRPADPNDTRYTFLFPDGDEGLWVGTAAEGVLHINVATRERTRFAPDQEPPWHLSEQGAQLMVRDPGGGLLLAGESQVHRHTEDAGFVAVAGIDRGRVADLAFSPDGSLWIASDASLSRWALYADRAEWIADYDIAFLVEQAALRQVFPIRDDEIWLVLSNGVARLNPRTGESRLFSRSDGLPQMEFVPRASTAVGDGRILIGGTRGLVLVNPDQLAAEPAAPPVHLTRVTAGDFEQIMIPGLRPNLSLSWRQTSVRFDFSALTFVAPERVRYRVRLYGWDDDWIELRELGQMYYSNLSPGTYRFQVQATTAAGRWNEDGDSIVLHLAPPPWASPLAYVGYAGILTLALATGWNGARQARRRRLYLQKVQQKRSIAEAQRQLLQRLNVNLEPLPLAQAITQEILRLTGADSACFGYVHELMPRDLLSAPEQTALARAQWRDEISAADGMHSQVVDLEADRELVARVLLRAPAAGFQADHEQQLALMVDLAGQALHNSLLLQRVTGLATRAEAANKAKSEFLATMSHEIRTPLHGVLGMADLLHDRETEADRLELINTLRSSGRQLQRVIDDVLDVSQIEAGRLSVKQEYFELVSVLEHIVDLHAPNAARKQLGLRLSIQSDLPVAIRADADRLAQILGNLLSNAVKFTDHGAIELAAMLNPQGQLVFAVRDSGPGIHPQDRSRLFQAFSQLDGSIRRVHGGSGLGLAICRSLSEAMGGSLELADRRWPGSTFLLTLPYDGLLAPTPLTRLLDGVMVAALLDGPSFRILLRYARRWGFRVCNGWRSQPDPAALVLVDSRLLAAGAEAQRWLAGSPHGLFLESPYGRNPQPLAAIPGTYRFLRWPLQEGRLISALMDHVLAPE